MLDLGGICEVPNTRGAFYIFLRLRSNEEPLRIVEQLVSEHKVAVMPGTAFGMEEGCHLRISYGALARETALEGLDRLARGLRALQGA